MRNRPGKSSVSLMLFCLLLLAGLPTCAVADVGVPLIALTLPSMILALIPIVLLEAAVVAVVLRLPFHRLLLPLLAANGVSTVVGIPFAWIVQFIIEALAGGPSGFSAPPFWERVLSVTLGAAWLMPVSRDTYWMVPTACLVSLVPAFFVSIYLEYRVLMHVCYDRDWFSVFDASDPPAMKRGIIAANLASYGLLLLVLLAWLIAGSAAPQQ